MMDKGGVILPDQLHLLLTASPFSRPLSSVVEEIREVTNYIGPIE
jgi:hypothetical protein